MSATRRCLHEEKDRVNGISIDKQKSRAQQKSAIRDQRYKMWEDGALHIEKKVGEERSTLHRNVLREIT